VQIKVAVVGIGKMGLLHAGIMNGLDDVALCAISDSSKFLLGFARTMIDVPVYSDYKRLLDKENPDIVVLTTPVFLHIPMAMECAKRGIPFFLEKPLCLNAEEAVELVESIDQQNLPTMVGYMMRYVETFSKAKEIIDSKAFGEIINFSATIYVSQLFKTGKGWRYNIKESGGGVVMGQATHVIDLLRWYFGDVERISAHTKCFYSKQVEDFAHVFFDFQSGVNGWMDSSWSIRHHRLLETEIKINARNGNLSVNDDSISFYLDSPVNGYEAGWTYIKRPDLFKGVQIDLGGTHFSLQDIAFVEAVRKNQKVDSDLKNAYKVQRLVDAIYRSANNNGTPVEL
jgi:predicted dehydrogenase